VNQNEINKDPVMKYASNGVIATAGGMLLGSIVGGNPALGAAIGAATGLAGAGLGIDSKALIDAGLLGGGKEFIAEAKRQYSIVKENIKSGVEKMFGNKEKEV
jgi:uncharacterized membrane protein